MLRTGLALTFTSFLVAASLTGCGENGSVEPGDLDGSLGSGGTTGSGGKMAGSGGTATDAGTDVVTPDGGAGGKTDGGTGSGGAGSGGKADGGSGSGGAGSGGSGSGGSGSGGAGSGGNGSGGSGAGGSTPVTIWIAGDSTVATGGSACPNGWGGQFDPLFNDKVTVKNSAVAGRSIRTWLYSVQSVADSTGECVLDKDASGNPTLQARWQDMLTNMKAGDYLMVQFGINDGSTTCPRHVGSAAFVETLKMMGQAATSRGAHPIFLTSTGAIKCSGSVAQPTRGFITETKTAATAVGAAYIDLHALTTALYNKLAFCPLPAGNTDVSATTGGAVGAFFCADHTHFEVAGAQQIAGVIAKALRDQNIPLSAYLK